MSEPKGDILHAISVVAAFNEPLWELARNWEAATTDTANIKRAVAHEVSLGSTFFEALAKSSPRLADAVHDFVYQIALAHRSVIAKDLAREQVIKVILQL